MRADSTCKVLLLVISIFLGVIALRPFFATQHVYAQSSDVYPFFIEPGYTTLRAPDGSRQVTGKMVVDLRNGDIWGFPTLTASPYPVDSTSTTPPTSRPMYLGKFDFARTSQPSSAP